MILMQAPGPKMNFGTAPSGAAYASDRNGLVLIVNNSTADQLALIAAGCATLTPFGGWGNFGFTTLSSLYAADAAANLVLPGVTGFPEYTVATIFNDAGNTGTWSKTGTGAGSGNWTQQSTQTLASISALVGQITALQAAAFWYAQASFSQVSQVKAALVTLGVFATVENAILADPTNAAGQQWTTGGICTQTGPLGAAIQAALSYSTGQMNTLFADARSSSY